MTSQELSKVIDKINDIEQYVIDFYKYDQHNKDVRDIIQEASMKLEKMKRTRQWQEKV